MPTVIKLYGFRFYFYSREEPRMHVHICRDELEAKVWLDNFEVASNSGFKIRELMMIQRLVKEYEKEIKAAWTAHFNKS